MRQSNPEYIKLHIQKPEFSLVFFSGQLLLFTVLALLVGNAASAASRMQDNAPTGVSHLPVVKLKKTDPLTQTIKKIDTAKVVLVGETHTRYDHHLVQLEILKQLYQKSPELALGVEWFQQPFQEHLDAFISGEITEKEMLHRTEYFDRWRYDYRLYRPIMQYAREHKIPIVALNAPRELTKAVVKTDLDDLPAELQAHLPDSYDWSDKEYEKRLREIFESHDNFPGEFEDFLRSQLTWDESMAERAVEYLDENPDSRILILAGSGHIAYGSGIPNRIKRRADVELFSILVSEDFLDVSESIADYLVLSTERSLEPVGLIGAILDTQDKVVIKAYSHNSAIKEAGVEKGAVIIGVDNESVESFADFKLAIMDKKRGDSIELHYLENAELEEADKRSVNLELR